MTNNTSILLVSFGTSYLESKEKTIDRIVSDVTNAFPGVPVYQAWTSKMILRILRERDNLSLPTLEEAMSKLSVQPPQTLIVQPTHFLHGLEHERMMRTILEHAPKDLSVRFGAALLSSTDDHRKVLDCLLSEYSFLSSEEALVLMGHGTSHHANSVYAALDYMLKDLGHSNAFMGTVEAYPDLSTLIRQVKKTSAKRVHLVPFMLCAGDHANNDMAGAQKKSWKSLFEAAGFEVRCHLHGLGEYPAIRDIYLEHLKKAAAD